MHTHAHTHMHARMHAHHTHTHSHARTCAHTHTHTHAHTYMHACPHTHTHTHTHTWIPNTFKNYILAYNYSDKMFIKLLKGSSKEAMSISPCISPPPTWNIVKTKLTALRLGVQSLNLPSYMLCVWILGSRTVCVDMFTVCRTLEANLTGKSICCQWAHSDHQQNLHVLAPIADVVPSNRRNRISAQIF